jgi:hypothetical protein
MTGSIRLTDLNEIIPVHPTPPFMTCSPREGLAPRKESWEWSRPLIEPLWFPPAGINGDDKRTASAPFTFAFSRFRI